MNDDVYDIRCRDCAERYGFAMSRPDGLITLVNSAPALALMYHLSGTDLDIRAAYGAEPNQAWFAAHDDHVLEVVDQHGTTQYARPQLEHK